MNLNRPRKTAGRQATSTITYLMHNSSSEEQDSDLLYAIRSRRYPSKKEAGKTLFLVFFQVDKELPLIGAGRDPDKQE